MYEELTALADCEIKDPERISYLKEIIRNNRDCEIEYKIQTTVKSVVSNRVLRLNAPHKLQSRIIESTTGKARTKTRKNNSYINLFLNKKTAFAAAVFAITSFIFILLNDSGKTSPRNMYKQAEANFVSLMNGKLKPQKLCGTPEEVKSFFSESGVNYAAFVPKMVPWKITGAVVSDEAGTKLAHHIYSDDSGHLIYLYQVNRFFLENNRVLELPDEISSACYKGDFIKLEYKNHSTFIFRYDDNIITLVTNDNPQKVEKYFISECFRQN